MNFKLQTFTENLIPIIYKLDQSFYGKTVNKSWYNRYVNKAKIVLYYNNDSVVGYLIAARVTKNLFNQIVDLQYSGDINFSPCHFLTKSHYYYLASVLVLNNYQNKGIATTMQNMMFNKVLAGKKVCTIGITDGGKALANQHLTFVGKCKNSNIYSN